MDVIYVEGIIGAGKSTLISKLQEQLDGSMIVPEPIDIWMNCNGVDVLDAFYKGKNEIVSFGDVNYKILVEHKDPGRYCHSFQHLALTTRIAQLEKCKEHKGIVISERSHESCRYVFAQMLADDGKYDPVDWKVYEYEYEFLQKYAPKGRYVFLDTPVDECIKRMKMRGRSQEKAIPKDYLARLRDYHLNWLKGKPNVVILDGTLPFHFDSNVVRGYVKQIMS
jgi:deoxyadenosine/deoxycytidine kinase